MASKMCDEITYPFPNFNGSYAYLLQLNFNHNKDKPIRFAKISEKLTLQKIHRVSKIYNTYKYNRDYVSEGLLLPLEMFLIKAITKQIVYQTQQSYTLSAYFKYNKYSYKARNVARILLILI